MEMYYFIKAALVFAFGLWVQGSKGISKPANPECPDPQGQIGVCGELCYSDKDCPCSELCCSNGCGHECISTTQDKPGSCGSPWYFVWCGDKCQQDADCSGHLKCCPTIWGHVCKEPYLSPWY
ncbi:WAP four-disulfide core domain protein 3 isoform X2 [Gambusia affinis]|uniref:WAP four-disulfide core domain protein 3 isoform X2 n=1 Tax=Gambusia affinis TaxID=33528 RepID=UPI001CDC7DC5|nr:WAP four-disulfide core domain protein 3 isoform X2 [Gambusia affinis]